MVGVPSKFVDFSFTITFRNNCLGNEFDFEPSTDTDMDHSYIVTEVLTLNYARPQWIRETDAVACPFANTDHVLKMSFPLTGDYDAAIFTSFIPDQDSLIDERASSITVNVQRNADMKLYSEFGVMTCDLSNLETHECLVFFRVDLLSPFGTVMASIASGSLTVRSVCFRLNLLGNPIDLWNVDTANQALWEAGYQLRDEEVSFYLPTVKPVLHSGEDSLE